MPARIRTCSGPERRRRRQLRRDQQVDTARARPPGVRWWWIFTIKSASDEAYRLLIRQFVSFYREALFNDHWGEQVHVSPDNSLKISMVSLGLDTSQSRQVWQPFLDWLARSPTEYSIEGPQVIGSMPARHWWDVEWRKENQHHVFLADSRPGTSPDNVWWTGDGGQAGWVIYGFESLWLPASLLGDDSQQQLADALFAASRHSEVELHFNKGLAGAPSETIEAGQGPGIPRTSQSRA